MQTCDRNKRQMYLLHGTCRTCKLLYIYWICLSLIEVDITIYLEHVMNFQPPVKTRKSLKTVRLGWPKAGVNQRTPRWRRSATSRVVYVVCDCVLQVAC